MQQIIGKETKDVAGTHEVGTLVSPGKVLDFILHVMGSYWKVQNRRVICFTF